MEEVGITLILNQNKFHYQITISTHQMIFQEDKNVKNVKMDVWTAVDHQNYAKNAWLIGENKLLMKKQHVSDVLIHIVLTVMDMIINVKNA